MRWSSFRIATLCGVILMLSGCVVGQSLDMDYQAAGKSELGQGVAVQASVADQRPYVTSGDKPKHYIGKYRSGVGIPYDVSTDNDEPLEELVERDIVKDLDSLGFKVVENGQGAKQLRITIADWNFDAYQNGKFEYALDVKVLDHGGTVIASNRVSDTVEVKGSFWTGAKSGFEKAMPGLYRDVIQALVRDNEPILSALTE